jgi:hypothetical protein
VGYIDIHPGLVAETHGENAMKKLAPLVELLENRVEFLEREVAAAESRGRHREMHHVRDKTLAFIGGAAAVLQREGVEPSRAHAISAELHDIMKHAVLGDDHANESAAAPKPPLIPMDIETAFEALPNTPRTGLLFFDDGVRFAEKYYGTAWPMIPLTDEQIVEIRDEHLPSQGEALDCIAYARAIERAHGIATAQEQPKWAPKE